MWDIGIRLVLTSPTGIEGERGENKMEGGGYFPLYSTTASMIVILVMYIEFFDLQINIQYLSSILYLEDA